MTIDFNVFGSLIKAEFLVMWIVYLLSQNTREEHDGKYEDHVGDRTTILFHM